MTRLSDLGERKIIETIIPKYCDKAVGDDCAIVEAPSSKFATTIDPVPNPASNVLGSDPDLYWMGWLLVTISASDLAAAGAAPVAFLAALELIKDLEVERFERLLEGIRDSCHRQGLRYVGGNLKERIDRTGTSPVHAVGTAIGSIQHGRELTRHGAKPGDSIIIIGHAGRFWADGLYVQSGGQLEKRNSPVFAPISQLPYMHELVDGSGITASIDNSDGLLPSVEQLCKSSGIGAFIDLELLRKESSRYLHSSQSVSEPERLAFGWGDWNVVLAVAPNQVDDLLGRATKLGTRGLQIGQFQNRSGVEIRRGGRSLPAPRVDSERFASDSWFEAGIGSYIDQMMKAPLP